MLRTNVKLPTNSTAPRRLDLKWAWTLISSDTDHALYAACLGPVAEGGRNVSLYLGTNHSGDHISALFAPAAKLAGPVGWFFMVPPLTTGTFEVDTGAPLMRWSVMERFDSAEDCEREQSHILGNVHDQSWRAEREKEYRGLRSGALRSGTSELIQKSFEQGKCISANDPRLKQ